MDSSVAGPRSNSAGLEVNVSLEDARVRMRAAANVARHAMDESGRLTTHAVGRTLAVLRYASRLTNETQATSPVVTSSVEQHLFAKQQAFLKHVELIEANAQERILSLADWTPPSIGPLESFLRMFGVYLRRHEEVAEDEHMKVAASVVNGAHTREGAVGGASHGGYGDSHNTRPQWSRPAAANGSVGGHSNTDADAHRNGYRV